MARLKDKYTKEIVPRLMEISGYTNVMQVPRMEKIVLNIGMGEAIANAKSLEAAEADLVAIAGQHALTTRSRKSIANFKLRQGMPIGLKVTLRGERMWAFFDKLVTRSFPVCMSSRESPQMPLTAAVIIPSALKSKSFSRK